MTLTLPTFEAGTALLARRTFNLSCAARRSRGWFASPR